MVRHLTFVLFIVLAVVSAGQLIARDKKTGKKESPMHPKSVLDFTMNTIDGKAQPLSTYKGNVLMVINTASECGFTPQYETLQKLYETYKDKGFRILAFRAALRPRLRFERTAIHFPR